MSIGTHDTAEENGGLAGTWAPSREELLHGKAFQAAA